MSAASGSGQLLNTATVARRLDLTPWTVNYLARTAQLPCETLPSGQHVFRQGDVVDFGLAREQARLMGVTAARAKKRGTSGEPRQMSFLGTQLRALPPRRTSSTDSWIPARGLLSKQAGS